MKISDIINETPLPPDWDASSMAARKGTTFKSRLNYALERAKKIGRGSSRVAFIIPYEGRDTVLKVALNRKGMAQNAEEANILGDGYFSQLGCLIPMIDYDTVSGEHISWLHVELATPMKTREELKQALGGDIYDVIDYAETYRGKFKRGYFADVKMARRGLLQDGPLSNREDDFVDWAEKIYTLIDGSSLDPDDLVQPQNWGWYQGRPVIIDAGYAGSVIPMYAGK